MHSVLLRSTYKSCGSAFTAHLGTTNAAVSATFSGTPINRCYATKTKVTSSAKKSNKQQQQNSQPPLTGQTQQEETKQQPKQQQREQQTSQIGQNYFNNENTQQTQQQVKPLSTTNHPFSSSTANSSTPSSPSASSPSDTTWPDNTQGLLRNFRASDTLLSLTPFASTSKPPDSEDLNSQSLLSPDEQGQTNDSNKKDNGNANVNDQIGPPISYSAPPFDTRKFVSTLTSSKFDNGVAEQIMRATQELIETKRNKAQKELVSRADLENEAYLFGAALSELRTEVQVKARNDGIALRSAHSQLQREVDSLSQKASEDTQGLKNEIQLEMNTQKEETSSELKSLELKIIDLGNKFMVATGDLRTDLEAKKWDQTRKAIGMIALVVILVVGYTTLTAEPVPPAAPSVDDLGIKRQEDQGSESTGWNWSAFGQSKRVGEEEYE